MRKMPLLIRLAALLALFALSAKPALAQSVLRDAETEALLRDMTSPLAAAAGLDPDNVDVVLINDPSINAFVAGGQTVYIHSGLLQAADQADEVQGVIAHELGHITGGHVIRYGEGFSQSANISILSLILAGVAAAAGSGEAAAGVMAAGQQAALGKFLAFSRVQESSADAAGATYLSRAGISGRGSLEFFKKLQNQAFRYGYRQDDGATFGRTHPLSGDRIATLREVYVIDPAWDRPVDPDLQRRFMRVKAKLAGFISLPQDTLRVYNLTMTGIPARYARAYAYHKNANVDLALAETDALLEMAPDDPYFLELKGQVLLESGRPLDALESLRRATELSGSSPLIASMFGHALIATEDEAYFDEAVQVLKNSVSRDRRNPFAWYQLGVVYAARGDMARARLASAEQQILRRQYGEALISAGAAEAGLPTGTPDWLRAQDIGLQARAEIEQQDRRR